MMMTGRCLCGSVAFTAEVETAPPVDPGDLASLTLRRTPVSVTDEQVTSTIERLERAGAKRQVEDLRAEPPQDVPATCKGALQLDWPAAPA